MRRCAESAEYGIKIKGRDRMLLIAQGTFYVQRSLACQEDLKLDVDAFSCLGQANFIYAQMHAHLPTTLKYSIC